MTDWSSNTSDHVVVAVPSRMYWRTWDDPIQPSVRMVSFDWVATLSIMRSTALKAYHRPLRWEVNHRFASLVPDLKEFNGLPVEYSEGSLVRLICAERTYELDLNA